MEDTRHIEFKDTRCGVAVIVAASLLLNLLGKFAASRLGLPLWLDSVGTCLAAYLYGPACGAIVGAGLNISHGIFDSISLVYGLVSVALGIACGILARRKFFATLYGAFCAGFVLAFVSMALSTPLKMLFHDGYSGNLWNDGVFEMLLETGFPRWICAMMGDFAIEFIDKNLTVLLLFLLLKASALRKKKKFLTCSTPDSLRSSLLLYMGWRGSPLRT